MPKILYIEDDLQNNIATIKKFFAPILKDKRIIKALDELANTKRVYAEDVIRACSLSSFLDIVHTFPLALERIIHSHKSYDLILIDRNLSNSQYDIELEQLIAWMGEIGMSNMQDRILDYFEREGDLLLKVLLRINPAYKDKTYFLTANVSDALRQPAELQNMLDLDSFTGDHIIEKGSKKEKVISEILKDMRAFRIQNNYREQCEILRNRLTEDDVGQFISMIKYWEDDQRREFVLYLRKLLDNLLHDIGFNAGEFDAPYWNPSNNKQLQIKSFIKGFERGGRWFGLPQLEREKRLGYDSIIRNACLSIFEISSDCGVHELSKAIDLESLSVAGLSKWTLNSLMNQICEVILWYDKAMGILTGKS